MDEKPNWTKYEYHPYVRGVSEMAHTVMGTAGLPQMNCLGFKPQ